MSTKLDATKVADILKSEHADPALIRAVVEKINILTMREEDEKEPTIKKQFAIVISDPENRMPKADFVGWVVRLPEDESIATTKDRIYRGAYDFNASKRGRLLPVKTVGEALESVPAKHFKDSGLWISTKTPVLVVVTNNEIPVGAKE